MSFTCVLFVLLIMSSVVRVVFVLSASLSDVAPVFPILLSVVVMINKTKNVYGCLLCVFLSLSLPLRSS